MVIQSDPIRLRQILVNLLGNAVKFTESGKIEVAIKLLMYEDRLPQLRFTVTDTGVGMTRDQLAMLFQPFAQVHSGKERKYGGTGLGLAISQRLAEMLGGSITAKSEGHGSTFTLTIDTGSLSGVAIVGITPQRPLAPPPEPVNPVADEERLHCRILLAEDGPDNQRLIAFLLRRAGAETVIAENGEIAMQFALAAKESSNPFDVILMDMQMPVMDGYTATRKLRDAGYAYPIVALTAHAMNQDCDRCLSAGCDAYLTKPIDRHILLQTIKQITMNRQQKKAPITRLEIVGMSPENESSPNSPTN
jgi:ammonium transporter, Amt family